MNRWALVLLSALAVPAQALWGKSTVPVSVHGVNYSNQEFSYTVEDPANPKNKAGGELLNRFAAGGTMCCYELPRQWKPGLQIKVNSTYWLPKQADGKLPEIKQTFLVDVPSYVDGKPGELWVLRLADGSVKVVSSDYQPDHENWPGEIKGWPVPSEAYRQERVRLHLNLAEGDVSVYKELLSALEITPDRTAAEAWASKYKYRRDDLKGFDGPEDSRFRAWLKSSYQQSLKESETKARELKKVLQ